MGCEWRIEIDLDAVENKDLKPLFDVFRELDEGFIDGEDDFTFYASYGFRISDWLKWDENKGEILKQYKGLALRLYCLEQEADEYFDVE